MTSDPGAPSADQPARPTSGLGHFIERYSSFLSSFVIGLAGLIATSIWQYRQSVNAQVEARSQEALARTKADNDWKIARAEILAKNLDVLAVQGPGSADRKFGVLLSLTRGSILDPELAVSYALELGKENAYYMRSVLSSTPRKSYAQLAQAFVPSCLQRFGVEKDIELCRDDKLSDRSDTIAALVQDELEAAGAAAFDPARRQAAGGEGQGQERPAPESPLGLLEREDEVQSMPVKLAWLFEPYLQDLYERRRWSDIDRFEGFSQGARLVSALVLATSRTGELVSEQEGRLLADFHTARRRWLATYLFGRTCDADCRAHLVEFMLSTVRESDGDYDEALTQLLTRPRAEVSRAINHIHGRLLWCQIDADDLRLLAARVIVPAAASVLGPAPAAPPRDPALRSDLVELVALLAPPGEPGPGAEFEKVLAAIRADPELRRLYASRVATAQRQRTSPPPMVKKVNFCGAASGGDERDAAMN